MRILNRDSNPSRFVILTENCGGKGNGIVLEKENEDRGKRSLENNREKEREIKGSLDANFH
jgi:hypothetical protein